MEETDLTKFREKEKEKLLNEPIIVEIQKQEQLKELADEIMALYDQHLSYYESIILKRLLTEAELKTVIKYLYYKGNEEEVEAIVDNVESLLKKDLPTEAEGDIFAYLAEKITKCHKERKKEDED